MKQHFHGLHLSYIGYTLGIILGFSGGSDSKESICNAGDPDLIPGLGRSTPRQLSEGGRMGSWVVQVMKPSTWQAPSLLPEAKANLDPAHATPVVKVHKPDHRTMQPLPQPASIRGGDLSLGSPFISHSPSHKVCHHSVPSPVWQAE